MERTLEPEQYVLVDKLTPGSTATTVATSSSSARPRASARGHAVHQAGHRRRRRSGRDPRRRGRGERRDARRAVHLRRPGRRTAEPTRGGRPRAGASPGDVFLLGDHRAASDDSRAFGPVAVDSILGRAWLALLAVCATSIRMRAPPTDAPGAARRHGRTPSVQMDIFPAFDSALPTAGSDGRLRRPSERASPGSAMSATPAPGGLAARHRRPRRPPRLQRQAEARRRPRRRRPRGRAGRVLRPARAQRRGQDDADQDPDDAAPADARGRPGSSASTSATRRKQIRRIMNMVAGGEQSGYGILTVREQLWMFSQFYGLAVARRLAPGRRADRGGRPRRAAPAAGQHAVDRPAPEDELRARPAQRPVDPLPRRADARPRRRRRALGPRARRSPGRPPSRAGRSC